MVHIDMLPMLLSHVIMQRTRLKKKKNAPASSSSTKYKPLATSAASGDLEAGRVAAEEGRSGDDDVEEGEEGDEDGDGGGDTRRRSRTRTEVWQAFAGIFAALIFFGLLIAGAWAGVQAQSTNAELKRVLQRAEDAVARVEALLPSSADVHAAFAEFRHVVQRVEEVIPDKEVVQSVLKGLFGDDTSAANVGERFKTLAHAFQNVTSMPEVERLKKSLLDMFKGGV